MLEEEEGKKVEEPAVPSTSAARPAIPRLRGPLSARKERDCTEARETHDAPTTASSIVSSNPSPSPSLMGDDDDDESLLISDDEEREFIKRKRLSLKRKRGRPPTTGEYAGLAAAQKALNEANERAMELEVQREVLTSAHFSPKNTRSKGKLPSTEDLAKDWEQDSEAELDNKMAHALRRVNYIVDVSKNLKGTFVNELRREFKAMGAITKILQSRTATPSGSEMNKLREANTRLKEQVDSLRGEMAVLRRELDEQRERMIRSSSPLLSGSVPNMRRTPSRVGAPGPSDLVPVEPEVITSALSDNMEMPPPKQPPPRPRGKRGSRTGSRLELRASEEALMERLGSLMDEKLRHFACEYFPGGKPLPRERRTVREPLSATRSATAGRGRTPSSSRVEKSSDNRGEEPWSKVVGRRARKAPQPWPEQPAAESEIPLATGKGRRDKKGSENQIPTSGKKKMRRPRPPKTAAVMISIPVEERGRITMLEAINRARAGIQLSDIGIADMGVRRSFTGGLILEIAGEDKDKKADDLASRMRATLEGSGVRVARPTKRAELRVRGLDDSITPEEVATALASVGNCTREEIRVGQINRSTIGLGTIWVQCPVGVASAVAKAGKITVGWVRAPVELLRPRPMTCFRCLESGHTQSNCSGPDRGDRCYRCGRVGHRASACTEGPQCPLCGDLGRPASHRLGGAGCVPPSSGKRGGRRGSVVRAAAQGRPPSAPPMARREGRAANRAQIQAGKPGGEAMDTI